MQEIKVLIIDDNFIIRDQIKRSLEELDDMVNQAIREDKLEKWRKTKNIDKIPDIEKIDFKIYSADDGVEGLGYMYAIKPDLVIVDTTLPKYSGKEILDFIQNNTTIETKVIVMSEEKDDNRKYVTVNKKDRNFLNRLEKEVRYLLNIPKTHVAQGRVKWGVFKNNLVNLANRSDLLLSRYYRSSIFAKLKILPYWILSQLVISLMYFINTLFTGRSPKDESIEQAEKDLLNYRVRYYPTLITVFTTILILLVQVGLFVSGGLVIFNTRIESIFALAQDEKGYGFSGSKVEDYEYDDGLIEIINNGLSLKLIEKEITIPEEDLPESFPQEILEPESYPGVLGASTQSSYSAEKPFVITKNPIKYSDLKKIIERSSLNSEGSSTLGVEEYGKQLEKLEQDDPRKSTKITYQLSPSKNDWYYWNGTRWENTKQGWVSSNTIQEINDNLTNYEETLGTGELFMKIFLHSTNGKETPILKEVVVEREQEMVSQVVTTLPEAQVQQQNLSSVNFDVLEPVILNAAYVNGEKVIKGRLLPKNRLLRVNYSVTQEELDEYEVNIYYSDKGQATKNSLIGITNLYLNSKGIPEFFMRTPESDGGYVTAQVVRKVNQGSYANETPESYIVENPLGASDLASPLKNSSFVVTSTGDGSDTSAGDASCDDGTGECTLRAAIQESNALAGADIIYFDIPTTDPNYLDYDNPTAGSNSGDSADGDDYWSIQPNSALPQITETLTIDGATTNGTDPIPDTNTSGPEIEIDGVNAGSVNGFYLTNTATNSRISSLVINNFNGSVKKGIILYQNSDSSITNVYFGSDIKGVNEKSISVAISLNQSSNVSIENNKIMFSDTGITTLESYNVNIYGNVMSNLSWISIDNFGSEVSIKGNFIDGGLIGGYGIANYPANMNNRLDGDDDVFPKSTIGGTNSLVNSKCKGTEKNCIGNFEQVGIISFDNIPLNEATLFEDNDFTLGPNGIEIYFDSDLVGQANIMQVWKGAFEIFSNDSRRIDLPNESIQLEGLPKRVFLYMSELGQSSGYYPRLINYTTDCLDGSVYCPDSGQTSVINASIVPGFFPRFEYWYDVFGAYPFNEYIINDSGEKIYEGFFKFDEPHIASGEFSFDGDSTTHPVDTGSLRSINGYDYYDRGEPWTDNPDANRDLATQNFGRFQIMEVELVDANPVLQDDGTYVITVDSTTDEDNVSTAGYDCGTGTTYECGGSEGSDGLADGKTSLREAIYVANQHPGKEYIHFDIPVDDVNHKCYRDDGVEGQVTEANIETTTVLTDSSDNTCGSGTADPDHPYSWFDMQTTGAYTITSEVILDGYTQEGSRKNTASMGETLNHVIKIDTSDATLNVNGGSSEISGIAVSSNGSDINLNSDNNHVYGINLGFDISGLIPYAATSAGDYVYQLRIRGDNNTVGASNSEIDYANYINLINGGNNVRWQPRSIIDLDSDLLNLQISFNRFGTGRKGNEDQDELDSRWCITNYPDNYNIEGLYISGNVFANCNGGIVLTRGGSFINSTVNNNKFNTDWDDTVVLSNETNSNAAHPLNTNGANSFSGEVSNNIARGYTHTSGDQGYLLSAVLDNTIVKNNFIDGVSTGGLSVQGASEIDKSVNIHISDNKITNTGGLGLWGRNLSNSIIEDNWLGNNCTTTYNWYNSFFWSVEDSVIRRNYIGTTNDGVSSVNDGCWAKMVLRGQTGGNIVGGETLDYANIFSGNKSSSSGIYLYAIDSSSEINTIKNNYLGINKTGDEYIGLQDGISSRHKLIVENNIIGVERNAFSYYQSEDQIEGAISIKNNCIGTKSDCETPLDSPGGEITIIRDTQEVLIENNTIGNFTDPDLTGISIGDTSGTYITEGLQGVSIKGNKIYNMDGLAIDIIEIGDGDNIVTPNDPSDTDTGVNDLMNYPVIEQVEYLGAGRYKLYGDLDNDVTDESPFEIEVCESYDHESGHGGCLQTLGFTTANSLWEKTVKFEGDDGTQERIFSILATNAKGSTSEFSENFKASSDNPNYYIVQYPIELVYPIGGQEIVDRTPLLDWNENGDPDIDHWEVYLGRSADNLQKIGEIEGSRTNFQVSKSLPLDHTTYYWKVVDIRKNGTIGGESDTESFNVVENLQHLNLIYPTGGIKIDEVRPMFQWTQSSEEDVTYYELYLREKMPESYAQSQSGLISQENKLTRIEGNDTTEYQPMEDLKLADYEWQVVAYYADAKESGRSEVGDFSIIESEVTVTQGRVERPDGAQEYGGDLGQSRGITVEQAMMLCCLCLCCMLPILIVAFILLKRDKNKSKEPKDKSNSDTWHNT